MNARLFGMIIKNTIAKHEKNQLLYSKLFGNKNNVKNLLKTLFCSLLDFEKKKLNLTAFQWELFIEKCVYQLG